jgi:hypothetical protein
LTTWQRCWRRKGSTSARLANERRMVMALM